MLLELAKGMIFEHNNTHMGAMARRRMSRKLQKRGPRMLTDDEFMFARLPPDPPRECQVVSTSAYSVRLAWAPAFSADDQVTFKKSSLDIKKTVKCVNCAAFKDIQRKL